VPNGFRLTTCCITTGGEPPIEGGPWGGTRAWGDVGIAGHRPTPKKMGGYSATAAGHVADPGAVVRMRSSCRPHGSGRGPTLVLIAGPALAGIGLLLIRPKANGFHAFTDLVPGVTVLAIGLVATITPLMSVMLASVPTERSGLASAINNAVSRLAALISIGSMGVISGGTASAIGFAHVVRGERRTIRRERVVRRAADNRSPCAPTCTQRHLGVVPRSARCATRPGQQPLGGGRTIPSAVIVHPLRRTPP
jgi:hypothetical protein